MKAVGRPREEGALRREGWRPPLIPGSYQDLVFVILGRPEFKGQPTRAVVEAALKAYATAEELSQVDLPEEKP